MERVQGRKRLPPLAVVDHPDKGKITCREVVETKVKVNDAAARTNVENVDILVELGCVV